MSRYRSGLTELPAKQMFGVQIPPGAPNLVRLKLTTTAIVEAVNHAIDREFLAGNLLKCYHRLVDRTPSHTEGNSGSNPGGEL